MTLTTLNDLFQDGLADLYDAEQQIVKVLPKMAKAASTPALSEALTSHLELSRQHIARLEQVFENLELPPKRQTCDGMVGLLKEGQKMTEQEAPPEVRDAAIIATVQRVEHYEMAGYGCLRTWAHVLGQHEIAELLQETLDEEKAADQTLTEVAHSINFEAAEGEMRGEEEEEEWAATARTGRATSSPSSSRSKAKTTTRKGTARR
jgi:ferritin-like metal-binding protein YciE